MCFLRSIFIAAVLLTVAVTLTLPEAALAGPVIKAQVVAACEDGQAILTITLDGKTDDFYNHHGDGLEYHFDPPSTSNPPALKDNPALLPIPAAYPAGSAHTLQISDVSGTTLSDELDFTVPVCGNAKKGMTWKRIDTNPVYGTVRVGCANTCEPHHGDTLCSTALPVLCIYKPDPAFPAPQSLDKVSQYSRWSGGVVATTGAVPGPTSLAAANDLCAQELGKGWRWAEFHDGWGWGFQAYGGIGDPDARFWVYINDQPDGNCWK